MSHATVRARALAACAVGLLAVLTACTGAPSDPLPTSTDQLDPGFVSGDGRVQQWAEAERGEPVELTGTSYAAEPIDLATWRGGVVVVNFWYANCGPCRLEAPDLAAISAEYAERGVQFLGINHRDDPGTALAFEETFEVPYPSLDDRDAAAVAAMQGVVSLQATPTTVVLDPEGRVAARIIGTADPATLRGLIDDTLAA